MEDRKDLNMNDKKVITQAPGTCDSDCSCDWESMYKDTLEKNTYLEERISKLTDMHLKTKDDLEKTEKKLSKVIKLYNELLGHYLDEE